MDASNTPSLAKDIHVDLHNHLNFLAPFSPKIFKFRGSATPLMDQENVRIFSVAVYAMPWENYSDVLIRIRRIRDWVRHQTHMEWLSQKHFQSDFQPGKTYLTLHLESARTLRDPESQVPELKSLGVQGVIPLHFIDQQFGNSGDDPLRRWGLKKQDLGLSKLGHRLVELCNQHHLWIDISHASDPTAFDLIQSANWVMASHGGIRELSGKKRAFPLKHLHEIQKKNGVWGQSPWSYTLGTTDFIKALRFAFDQGLGESISLGTDFGAPIWTSEETRDWDTLIEKILSTDQLAPDEKHKILWENSLNFLKNFFHTTPSHPFKT